MSWASILKKDCNKDPHPPLTQVDGPNINHNSTCNNKNLEDLIFDYYRESTLFDIAYDIKEKSHNQYPWIFSKANTVDILRFIKFHINTRSSISNNIMDKFTNEDYPYSSDDE